MNLVETHDLLTLAAAFDNRKFGDETVAAWREVLSRESFEDARDAVLHHFKTSTEYLMPAHVTQRCREIRNERFDAKALTEHPPAVPLAERSANGEIEQLRQILPPARADILRRAEWVWRDRARLRQLEAEPNPDFTGPPPADGHPVPDTEESA